MDLDHSVTRLHYTRRHFFGRLSSGIGIPALAAILEQRGFSSAPTEGNKGLDGLPHFAPKAKRVIFLFQQGGPSQIELFDHKPELKRLHETELPDSVRKGQRLTGMTSGQSSLPIASPFVNFRQYGRSGTWVSDLLPYTSKIVDDITIINSVHTDAINHDPAITFIQTGTQQAGRPSLGSWITYGLGSDNENLPGFVVLLSQKNALNVDQPLSYRLWSSGFLPSRFQGVRFRTGAEPVLYLANPDGVKRENQRRLLDSLQEINQIHADEFGDPEIPARINQYEMAYRMQSSVPELMDLSKESNQTFELYGSDARKPGTFAANCLLARRLAERGVRFIQLYHRGWDQHFDLPRDMALQSKGTDQACAALIHDLKQRGMLDETLVVWGGEFGRTVYCQGKLTQTTYGRDHHPRCFTMWLAGGGIKAGAVVGKTDDFSYNILEDPVHVHDIQATIMHTLGIDHKSLTYKFQGRHFRLTDVAGSVVGKALT